MTTLEHQDSDKRDFAGPEHNGSPAALAEKVRNLRLPPEVVARRSISGLIAWGLCMVFASTTVLLAYRLQAKDAADSATESSTAGGVPVPPPVAESDSEIAHQAKGYVVPTHQILVSPKISGMIVELAVQEGKFFRKGEQLAKLEDTEYLADVQRAEATRQMAQKYLEELRNGSRPEEIARAEAEHREAASQREYLEAVWKRSQKLRETNVISKEQFDEAFSQYTAMLKREEALEKALELVRIGPRQERIAIAEADLARAEAELVKARWRLDNCKILAPIDGIILKKNAEEGNIVNPIAFNGSFSLCEMADLRDLEIDLSIQERDIERISPGQKCRVVPEAYRKRTYEGYVSRLMPIADRAKGAVTVRVKVTIPPDEGYGDRLFLKPEMGVIVTFLKGDGRQ